MNYWDHWGVGTHLKYVNKPRMVIRLAENKFSIDNITASENNMKDLMTL